MKNREIDKIVSEKVSSRRDELTRLDVDDLLALPPFTSEKLKIGDKDLNLCIFRDPIANHETLIVVQCKNTRYLGYGNIFAQGLVVDANRKIRAAEQELIWEYV